METISDLAAIAPNLTFGAEHEFFNRQDGFEGLIGLYSLALLGNPQKMSVSLNDQAMGKGDIGMTDAFATDAQILRYNLKIREDDKNLFPPYYAAPIVRKEILAEHPELEDVLNTLAALINDEAMTELNYQIDVENRDATAAAAEFLQSKGLIYPAFIAFADLPLILVVRLTVYEERLQQAVQLACVSPPWQEVFPATGVFRYVSPLPFIS